MFMVEDKGRICGFISGVAPHSIGGEDAGGDAISLGKLIVPGFEGGQPIWRRGNEGAAASGLLLQQAEFPWGRWVWLRRRIGADSEHVDVKHGNAISWGATKDLATDGSGRGLANCALRTRLCITKKPVADIHWPLPLSLY